MGSLSSTQGPQGSQEGSLWRPGVGCSCPLQSVDRGQHLKSKTVSQAQQERHSLDLGSDHPEQQGQG
jgi:hypothetical protein